MLHETIVLKMAPFSKGLNLNILLCSQHYGENRASVHRQYRHRSARVTLHYSGSRVTDPFSSHIRVLDRARHALAEVFGTVK